MLRGDGLSHEAPVVDVAEGVGHVRLVLVVAPLAVDYEFVLKFAPKTTIGSALHGFRWEGRVHRYVSVRVALLSPDDSREAGCRRLRKAVGRFPQETWGEIRAIWKSQRAQRAPATGRRATLSRCIHRRRRFGNIFGVRGFRQGSLVT